MRVFFFIGECCFLYVSASHSVSEPHVTPILKCQKLVLFHKFHSGMFFWVFFQAEANYLFIVRADGSLLRSVSLP